SSLMFCMSKLLIASGLADIVRQNALSNDLLATVVNRKTHALLRPGTLVSIDLPAQSLSLESGPTVTFPIDSFSKTCLLENLDELGYILKHEEAITAFESRD